MRTRLNKYQVQGRQINTFMFDLTIEDIRLIVNEDKKIVIASSMQKDNIVNVEGGVIYYKDTIVESDATDAMTIEIDKGTIDTTLYSPCDISALDAWWAEQSTEKEE